LLDFTAAHPGKGALATKNAVDLGTSDVTAVLPKAKVDSSGAWSQAEIPTLDKTKISSIGTFAQADIPTLDKSKINSTGAWADPEIPVLSTAKYPSALLQDGSRQADFVEFKDPGGGAVHRRLKNIAGKFSTTDAASAETLTVWTSPAKFEKPVYAGKVWVDGMPLAVTVDRPSTNHCKNPSFETNTASWEGYASDASGTVPTLSRDTSQYVFGGASLKVANADAAWTGFIGASMTTADAPAASNPQRWSASVWVRVNNRLGVTLSIEFRDGTTFKGSQSVSVEPAANTWVPITVNGAVADPGTTLVIVRVFVFTPNNTFDLWIDGVCLEQADVASAYFDGSFGEERGCAWSGTANASTSTRAGGLSNHGAMAASAPSLTLWEDGEFQVGAIAPAYGTAALIGESTRPLRLAGAGTWFPPTPTANDVFFRTDFRSLFFFNGTSWVQLSVGADSSAPGSPQTNQRVWDTDTKSENYYNGSAWKSAPFSVLLDDEIHFWDLATDPGSIAAQGRVNVGVSATGCTTTMVYWGWITSTLGLELSGSGVETGTDFAQHFCTSNGTLTHVFYNRDAANSSDRRSANSCTMGVDWS
jgi:hypothetical protein